MSLTFKKTFGKPKFSSVEIPFISDEKLDYVKDQQLTIDNQLITFTALNVGNPVAVVFVEDLVNAANI